MKANIHPEYNQITVSCNCGNTFKVGSTMQSLKVEICSNCHPYYTGKHNLVDTAGRVDKFEARRKRAAELKASQAAKKSKLDNNQEAQDGAEALKELRKTVLDAEKQAK